MPAISFSDATTYVVPAPSWRFFLTFPSIANSPVSTQRIPFLVQRVGGVNKSLEIEPVFFNGGVRHFPTAWTINNLTLTFVEDVGYTVVQAVRAWMDMVVDDVGNFGLPATYKKPVQLDALGFDGSTLTSFVWGDCMPISLDGYDWDGSQTNHIAPMLTLAVDNQQPLVFTGASSSTASSGVSSNSNQAGNKNGGAPVYNDAVQPQFIG